MEKKTKRTRKVTKKSALSMIKLNLKRLSFGELEEVIAWAHRYRKEKMGDEELRLLKEKNELELKLKDLKTIDESMNVYK